MSLREPRRSLLIRDEGVIDAFVGYRTWRVEMHSGVVRIRSAFQRWRVWPPGEVVEAVCKCRTPQHRCGIYAWREPYPVRAATYTVHGEVLLWGDVRIHTLGYRASHALPSGVYVLDTMDEHARRSAEMVAHQYGIPTILKEEE